jgi:hypothetical protein
VLTAPGARASGIQVTADVDDPYRDSQGCCYSGTNPASLAIVSRSCQEGHHVSAMAAFTDDAVPRSGAGTAVSSRYQSRLTEALLLPQEAQADHN